MTSALEGQGISAFWDTVLAHRQALEGSGEFAARRREQARAWIWSLVEEGLRVGFRRHPTVSERLPALEKEVQAQQTTPAAAARELLRLFREP